MEGGDEYWEDMLDDSIEELEEEFQELLSNLRHPETLQKTPLRRAGKATRSNQMRGRRISWERNGDSNASDVMKV